MGPLQGLKVVEIAGLGPAPFCAMLLADMGADVLRIERKDTAKASRVGKSDVLNRGRPALAMDLKNPQAVTAVLDLCAGADVFVEGFRPGVMERLGLGPQPCMQRNPRLVYGRMTGYGQTGPLAHAAGHDINYLAYSGMLHMFARAGQLPVPPVNLVADMGGGGMMLAFGIVCAVLEAKRSRSGQVVDAAMTEGAALLGAGLYTQMAEGTWDATNAGVNIADTGAHFYEVYETRDGKAVAVGAIEQAFYARLLKCLGLQADDLPPQMDRASWPEMKRRFATTFRTKTRSEWVAVFADVDACFAPVLTPIEAAENAHTKARGSFTTLAGVMQPVPAPRLSRTPGAIRGEGGRVDADVVLPMWGLTHERLSGLRAAGAIE